MAHKHSIYDSDTHFVVNPVTRAIINSSQKIKLIQGDHNSERFTFELSRFVEGHDMSLCDSIKIHYVNIGAKAEEISEDVYTVEDMQISPDSEGVVIFSWLISGNATQYDGVLNFCISFQCLDGTEIVYAWHTEIYEGITVGKGMNNGEAVIQKYSDVLEAWKSEVLADFDFHVEAKTNAEIAKIEAKAADSLASIPEDYTALAAKAERNSKRITNLEKGVMPDSFVTDDSSSLVKQNPDNALPYAAVNKVGGTTIRDASLNELKPTKVTEIMSRGANLYDGGDLSFTQSTLVTLAKPLEVGTYTIGCICTSTDTSNTSNLVSFVDGNGVGQNLNIVLTRGTRVSRSVTLVSPVSQIRFNSSTSYSGSVGYDGTFTDIMINRGATALPFEAYKESRLTIPLDVQDLDGYGEGVSGSGNIVDLDNGTFTKQFVKKLFDGSEAWSKEGTGNASAYFIHRLAPLNSVVNKSILSNLYETNNVDSTNTYVAINIYNSTAWGNACIYVRPQNASSMTVDAWKSQLAAWNTEGNPLEIVYEVTEPEVTDISDILSPDNMLEVYEGGAVEIVTDDAHVGAVPTTIIYQVM